jgi:hypothetical protein
MKDKLIFTIKADWLGFVSEGQEVKLAFEGFEYELVKVLKTENGKITFEATGETGDKLREKFYGYRV